MANSRLQRQLEKQTKKRLWLTIIGIIIVIVITIKFGIPFLINFSLFITKNNAKSDTNQSNNATTFIAAPNIDPIVSATNSAQIKISGTASSNEQISLYLNNILADETNVKNDGTFSFDKVSLQNGSNTIKVRAKQDNKQSDFSDVSIVAYTTTAPKLDINSPNDGQTFSKDDNNVKVAGKTDPDVKVTVNDFWAINNNGNFSYNLHLQNGDNQIKVIAVDASGNKTEKDIKVTYNQ